MTAARSGFARRAAPLLRRPELTEHIGHVVDSIQQKRDERFSNVDLDAMRSAGEAIRAHTVARLDRYLEEFAVNAEARGTRVFFASTGSEATSYVRSLLAERGVRSVAKGKSMASEEIGLNHALQADGIEVVETDLGEYILQLAGEPPAHIVAPAMHKSRAEIGRILSQASNERETDDPEALTKLARGLLRERFLEADAGVTGVNFGIASTGSLVLVTNEGNGRMCSTVPRIHIAIMGMERLLPSFRELSVMMPLLTASATGQKTTAYMSVINGPRRPGELDGPEEVHVVIVDNGRSSILPTEFRSVLHCIRCGACQNVCPVMRQVGGQAYGEVYGGPIGAVLTPLLVGFSRAGDLPHASSLCGACTEVCPVKIPLHEHLIALRREVARDHAGRAERALFRLWASAWSRPRAFRLLHRVVRLLQRPFVRRGRIRRAPFPLSRWTAGRDLPPVAPAAFRDLWRKGGR